MGSWAELGGKWSTELNVPMGPRSLLSSWSRVVSSSWLQLAIVDEMPMSLSPLPKGNDSVFMGWHVHWPIGGTNGTEMRNSMQIFLEKGVLGIFSYVVIDFSLSEVLILYCCHSCNAQESRRMLSKVWQWESTQTVILQNLLSLDW